LSKVDKSKPPMAPVQKVYTWQLKKSTNGVGDIYSSTHDHCIGVFANCIEITSLGVDIRKVKIYQLCRPYNETKR